MISQIQNSPVQKVIFISSTSVYARINKVMTEEDVVLETPLTEIENLFRENTFLKRQLFVLLVCLVEKDILQIGLKTDEKFHSQKVL